MIMRRNWRSPIRSTKHVKKVIWSAPQMRMIVVWKKLIVAEEEIVEDTVSENDIDPPRPKWYQKEADKYNPTVGNLYHLQKNLTRKSEALPRNILRTGVAKNKSKDTTGRLDITFRMLKSENHCHRDALMRQEACHNLMKLKKKWN